MSSSVHILLPKSEKLVGIRRWLLTYDKSIVQILMYSSQGILEEHAKVVFMSNAFMSRFCSCAICLLSLTNGQSFSLFLCH